MTNEKPNVDPNGRYELKAAAEALNVSRATLLRYTDMGIIKCGIRKVNGRKFWTGEDIIRLWNSCI